MVVLDQACSNRPTYIVNDIMALRFGLIDRDALYSVLLDRGVFKWFSVRRKLVKLKDIWKERLKKADAIRCNATSGTATYHWARGYTAALRECRKEVRGLCHSPRMQVQDNDKKAREWLTKERKRVELPNHNRGCTDGTS